MSSATIKVGDIIESYQGRFAKVVEINGSRYGLSPFVIKRAAAEAETVAVTFLNRFGLAQVMKGADVEAEAETVAESQSTEEGKAGGEKPLSKMNSAELKAKATELGIPATGTNKELVAAITAKLEEGKAE